MDREKRIVIIDDDPIFVYGTKRMLKDVSYNENISVFENGQVAIVGVKEMLNNDETLPSIIFLDLNMPIMNGWDFLDEFIKIPIFKRQNITVCIVSSSIDPRDLERVKEYEVVKKYIEKPFSRKNLLSVLNEMVV